MKLTLSPLYRKHLPSLGIVVILATLIWFKGPLLTLGTYTPLATYEERLAIMVLLGLAWFTKFMFIDTPRVSRHPTRPLPLPPEVAKQIARLEGQFKSIYQFLHKTRLSQHSKKRLAHLPWVLVMGPLNAGKTALLAKAGIHYRLAKSSKAALVPGDTCDWWVTRDVVLVDVPGGYLTPTEPPAKEAAAPLWQRLLQLLQQLPHTAHPKGMVLALNLPELLQQKWQQNPTQSHDLRQRIHDGISAFSPLPIHLVITKCDLLPGFGDFFSECTADDLTQAWGITLPPAPDNTTERDTICDHFDALIKRINTQLLTRLHHERDGKQRCLIKDFPLQLECLKQAILQWVNELSLPRSCLKGIYLTSALQPPREAGSAHPPSSLALPTTYAAQALTSWQAPPALSRAHFIRQWLTHCLPLEVAPRDSKARVLSLPSKRWVYGLCASMLVVACGILGRDFIESLERTYTIRTQLTHYQRHLPRSEQRDSRLLQALPLLDALDTAARSPLPRGMNFYTRRSQHTAEVVYQEALQAIVLPQIEHSFEGYLQTVSNKNPEQLYTLLSGYLMLGDKTHVATDTVSTMMLQLLATTLDRSAINELNRHIQAALRLSPTAFRLDPSLIAAARGQLSNLPDVDLALTILKSSAPYREDSDLGLGTHLGTPPVLVSRGVVTRIPTLYTASAFSHVMGTDSQKAALNVLRGNWVLGMHPIPPSQAAIDGLTAQLQTVYIAHYVDVWESLLANVGIATPASLADVRRITAILTGQPSPLLQLLQTIKQNTAFPPVTTASQKLQTLQTMMTSTHGLEDTLLYHVFVSLKTLDAYLATILEQPNTEQSSVAAAIRAAATTNHHPLTQLRATAEECPEPIKTWLTNLADQTWRFMLQQAGDPQQASPTLASLDEARPSSIAAAPRLSHMQNLLRSELSGTH